MVAPDHPAAGPVTFEGSSTFTLGLAVSTTGSVLSTPASILSATGPAATVTMASTGGPIQLRGAVRVAGTTDLTTSADELVADNPANDFAGSVLLTTAGGNATVRNANALRLGSCTFGGSADLAAAGPSPRTRAAPSRPWARGAACR